MGYQYNSIIESSYSTGDVSGKNYIGGLMGYQDYGNTKNSYSTGDVSGNNSLGGLVGHQNSGIIANSYATGNTNGNDNIGGLVGECYNNKIENCFTTGNVSGNDNVGGLMGCHYDYNNYDGEIRISNNYRYQLATRNGVVIPAASNDINGIHGGTKTAAELMTKTTYTGNSWLFNDSTPTTGPWYWDNRGFPKLNIGTENFPFGFNPGVPTISIIAQPATNTTFTEGNISGSLSVTASVTPNGTLAYQWYRNITNSNSGGTLITGATSASFTIPTTLTATGSPYYYYCVISSAGAASVNSNVATVRVNALFEPVTDIVNVPTTATVGKPLTLTGVVIPNNATNKTITWSVQNAGGTGANITGGNSLNTTAAGTVIITARIVNGTAVGNDYTKNFNIAVNVTDTPPTITTTSLPNGRAGAFYSQMLSATGTTPIIWIIDRGGLPDGLNLSNAGVIHGIPTTAGTFDFLVKAVNTAGNDVRWFSITINPDTHASSTMYLSPSILSTGKGRNFTFTFKVYSSQLYDFAECILIFDPNYLELQEVKPVLPPPWDLFSNTEERNKVTVRISNLSGAMLSGDNAMAALTFKALAETPGTNISMIVLPGYGYNSSRLQYQGNIINFSAYGSEVSISGVTALKASFQGRTGVNTSNEERLEIIWTRAGAFLSSELVSTDQNGEAEITIPSQNSDLTIWVKGERTLAASKYIGTVAVGSTVDVGTLSVGDANDDNNVDMNDFFIFASNFGKSFGNVGFNRIADFDNNGEVDMNDFFIFASNFGKTGAPRPAGAPMMSLAYINEYINEEMSAGEAHEKDSGGCNAIPMSVIVLIVLALSIVLPHFRKW